MNKNYFEFMCRYFVHLLENLRWGIVHTEDYKKALPTFFQSRLLFGKDRFSRSPFHKILDRLLGVWTNLKITVLDAVAKPLMLSRNVKQRK